MVKITEISREPLAFSFTPASTDVNINGVTHGGVLYYLCDEAIGRYVTAMVLSGVLCGSKSPHFQSKSKKPRHHIILSGTARLHDARASLIV